MALVLADGSRHMILIAYEYLVDELDACNPIAAVDFSITLHIALAAREVPKEVTPIHEVDLIAQEILQVFGESGNGDGLAIDTDLLTLEVTPLLVTLDMIALLGIHAREERSVIVFVSLLVSAYEILVGIIRIVLDHLGVDWRALLDNRSTARIALHVACKSLSEEERIFTILLAVQILGEREQLIGRVLVHRQLSR